MRFAITSSLLVLGLFAVGACPAERSDPPLGRSTARVEGAVVDASGAAIVGAEVRVADKVAVTGDGGRFTIDDVPGGSVVIEVHVGGQLAKALPARSPSGQLQIRVGTQRATELVFTGDVMFARRYLDPTGDGSGAGALADSRDPASFEALVQHVAPMIRAADVALPNVETAFGWSGVAHPSKPFVFLSPPTSVAALHSLGTDVALLANNHTYDFFDDGMRTTIDVLRNAGMLTVGAGMNETEAYRPLVITKGDLRLGVAPFCGLRICGVQAGDGTLPDEPPYQDAVGDKGGVAKLADAKLVAAIEALRPQSDRIAIVLHSGNEYLSHPTAGQQRAAHRAIDLGADIVVGHHPHVLQPLEVYNGKLIAYSLGNLVFDQDFRETWGSVLLRVSTTPGPERVSTYTVDPIWLEDYVPFPATGRLAKRIVRELAERSAPLGAVILDDGRIDVAGTATATDEVLTLAPQADTLGGGATLSLEDTLQGGRYLASASGDGIALGREVLGVGSFEHDLAGAPYGRIIGWNQVSESQTLVSESPKDGDRALRMCRDLTSSAPTRIYSAGRHRVVPGRTYSLCGCAKGHAMARARASVVYWNDVAAAAPPIATATILDAPPSEDWSCFCAETKPPEGALFVNVRLENLDETRAEGCSGPNDEPHCVDWDAIRLIEWQPWDRAPLPVPNQIEFLRTPTAAPVPLTVRTLTKEGP